MAGDPPDPDPDPVTMDTSSRRRIYQSEHTGPFTVCIRELQGKSLNPVTISIYLHKTYDSIIKCESSRHKIKITLGNRDQANQIACDGKITKECLVYIPAAEVEINGVIILPVGDDLTMLKNIGRGKFSHPDIPTTAILEATRLSKREAVNSDKFVETSQVKLCFPGTVLPRYVQIEKLLIPVRAYNAKAMFCDRCLRFNHTNRYCNARPVCAKCPGGHLTSECTITSSSICSFCRSIHTDSETCPFLTEVNESYRTVQENKRRRSYADAVIKAANSTTHNAAVRNSIVPDGSLPNSTNPNSPGTEWPSLKRPKRGWSGNIYDPQPSTTKAFHIHTANSFMELSDDDSDLAVLTGPITPTKLTNPWAKVPRKRRRSTTEGVTGSTGGRGGNAPKFEHQQKPALKETYNTSNVPPGFRRSGGSVPAQDMARAICQVFQLSEPIAGLIRMILPLLITNFPTMTPFLDLLIQLIKPNNA